MKYVLLIMWATSAHPEKAIDHIELSSKEACEAAATTIQLATNSTWSYTEPLLICIEKGTETLAAAVQ